MSAFATSYIPTTSASVTRAADAVSIATSLFNFGASAGTLYVSARAKDYSIASDYDNAIAIYKSTDSTNFRWEIGRVGGDYYPMTLIDAGATLADSTQIAGWTAGTTKKVANAFAANDANWAYNGTIGAGDNSIAVPLGTFNTLLVGSDGFTRSWNGHIAQVMHLPQRLANASLQTLTT